MWGPLARMVYEFIGRLYPMWICGRAPCVVGPPRQPTLPPRTFYIRDLLVETHPRLFAYRPYFPIIASPWCQR